MAQTLDSLALDIKLNVSGLAEVQQVQRRMQGMDRQIKNSGQAMNQFGRAATGAGRDTNRFAMGVLQQAGYQVGDYYVQVANGTSAMQAFGQQGAQLLGIFGPIGAVLGAGVAIFSAFAVAAERAGGSVAQAGDQIRSSFSDLKSAYADVEDAQQRYNDAIAAAAILQDSTSASIVAALGQELKARQALLRVQSAEYELQRFRAAQALEDLNEQIQALFDVEQAFIQLSQVEGRYDNPISSAGQYLPIWREIVEQNRELFLQQTRSRAELDLVDSLLDQINLDADAMIESFRASADEAERMSQALVLATSVQEGLDRMRIERGVAEGTLPPQALADAPLSQAEQTLQRVNEVRRRMAAAAQETMEETSRAGARAVQQVAEVVDPVVQQVESIAKTMESSFERGFMAMVDGTMTVKDAFRMMAADIIRELYRVLVVQRLVGSFTPGQGGTGIVGSIMGALGFRAMGGPMTANQPYIVGERGPELVVPSRNGTVIPNNQLGGQQPIVVNYNFQGGVTEADLARALPVFVQRTKREIVDAVQRGGSMSRAFG